MTVFIQNLDFKSTYSGQNFWSLCDEDVAKNHSEQIGAQMIEW